MIFNPIHWLHRVRHDPKSAQDACWLLNARDHMRGHKSAIKSEGFPWSVPPVEEWDVAACEAVHTDGHVIVHEGEWKPVKLADFWDQHLSHQGDRDGDLKLWRFQLSYAKRHAGRDRHKPLQVVAKDVGDLDPNDLDLDVDR